MVAVFWDVFPWSLVHVHISKDLAASTFIMDAVSYLYSLRTNIYDLYKTQCLIQHD
jgi:hypothetical protein